ncbi:hypothetical protein O5833_28185, partial [Escherichia coli]|nr:hypothetical protein [Escherichia coli]
MKDGKINLLDLNRQQMREFFKDLAAAGKVPPAKVMVIGAGVA